MEINFDLVKRYNKYSTKYNKFSNKYNKYSTKSTSKLNNLPQTLVVFKIFHNKTPTELTQKLFHRKNTLPIRNLQTRIVLSDNEDGKISILDTLVYYYFTGCVPPKIEIPNTFYVYREGLDEEFESIEYFNSYYVDGKEVKRLTL